MVKKTKRFSIACYLMPHQNQALNTQFKVNSAKQAKDRFLKKYEPSLVGAWRMEVVNESGQVILEFTTGIEDEIDLAIERLVATDGQSIDDIFGALSMDD